MKQFHYYLRDNKNNPIITVAVIEKDGIICRGISICSRKDIVCKNTGKYGELRIDANNVIKFGAYHRAEKAFETKKNSDIVKRIESRISALENLLGQNISMAYDKLYKSQYNVVSTEFEAKQLSKCKEIVG